MGTLGDVTATEALGVGLSLSILRAEHLQKTFGGSRAGAMASLRPSVVVVSLIAAVAVTALAALIPARRAVRLDLLESISAD